MKKIESFNSGLNKTSNNDLETTKKYRKTIDNLLMKTDKDGHIINEYFLPMGSPLQQE